MIKQSRAILLATLVAVSTIMTLAAAVSGWVQVRGAQAVQAMSRAAAPVTLDLVDQQFDAMQEQAVLVSVLASMQLLLLLVVGFALHAWHKQQIEARQRLEQLADELSDAKLAAETAARAKSQFLANMSHELRTPFQGVLGMLQLLEKTPLSRAQQELVFTARGSATHLLSILNEILDLSAIEAGKAILHPAPLDLHQLCKEVEAPMRVQAEERGLSLVIEVHAEIPTCVQGDATRIKQILFNLLNNAIKFTPKGHVRLDVRSTRLADGSFHLCFRVVDTGIGMDAETQAQLFQRFAPGDGSLTRRFGGTGLGLEISRNLARLMSGDLEASSELGKGSQFVLTLNLPQAVLQAHAVLPATPVRATRRSLRVMVVDDHPINRRYMGLVLESLHHQATFGATGAQALELVQQYDHDAILMDIHMPVMDGLEATRAIRALGGRFAEIPILALSADVLAGSRERAFAAGCNAFISKPIQVESLVAALGIVDEDEGGENVPVVPPPADTEEPSCLSPRFGEMAARLPKVRLRELLNMFFADESHALSGLREALAQGDVDAVHAAAHKCKGSARLLGLQCVADVAEEAETWARGDGPAREPMALIDAFDAALATCHQALAQWMGEPDSQPA